MSEIGKKGAAQRWGADLPLEAHPGVLQIGDMSLPCAVLSDETRVLTQTEFMRGMGMYYSGWVAKNRTEEDKAADVPHFFGFKSLKPFIDKHFGDLQSITVRYKSQRGVIGIGIRAEIIPKICEVWMDADEAGVLGVRQKQVAAKARLLMRALAYKAIELMIDNATGFAAQREQQTIAKYIEQYVAKDMRQWVRTFPRSFFEMLCRLRGIPFPENMRLPQYIGHDVNFLVWDRLAPGVRDELRRRNPSEGGRRKHKHFQFLTEHVGNPRLLHHLGLVEGIGSGFERGEMEKFRHKIAERFERFDDLPVFAKPTEPKALPRGKAISSSSGSDAPESDG